MTRTSKAFRKVLLATLVCLIAFFCAVRLSAQTPAPTPKPTETAKPEVIKLPPTLSQQLKLIQDRQDALAKEYESLNAAKVIVSQRAALELHLTAEQVDQMELVSGAEGYAFKPKEKAQAKPPDNKDTKTP